jgi:hypothetical protein
MVQVQTKPQAFGTEIEADGSFWVDQLNKRSKEIAEIDNSKNWDQIRAGTDVYMTRISIIPYLVTLAGAFFIARMYWFCGVLPSMFVNLCMFIYADFKGGVVHVVLDEPENINLPLLGPGALEFQMHHAIPRDNVIKPYIQMLGDLNTIVVICCSLVIFLGHTDPLAMGLLSSIILFSYVGQYAHRASHMSKKMRPQWVQTLQRWHILLPPGDHAKHHKTYDDNFPILNGWTAPFFSWAVKKTTNRWFWLVMLFSGAFLEVPVFKFVFAQLFNESK